MNQCTSTENTEEYENRIADFVTLTDIKNSPFDSIMLKYLILAINKRTNSTVQKNIRAYYRLKMVDILIDNFERIDNRDLLMLTKIINESIEKDHLNFITKWRFYPLVMAIFNRLLSYMEEYTQTTDYEKRKSIEIIIQPQLYQKIIILIYGYGYLAPENAVKLYKFIVSRDTRLYSDHNIVFNLLNTICYIPFVEIVGENNEITTIRKMLLAYF